MPIFGFGYIFIFGQSVQINTRCFCLSDELIGGCVSEVQSWLTNRVNWSRSGTRKYDSCALVQVLTTYGNETRTNDSIAPYYLQLPFLFSQSYLRLQQKKPYSHFVQMLVIEKWAPRCELSGGTQWEKNSPSSLQSTIIINNHRKLTQWMAANEKNCAWDR